MFSLLLLYPTFLFAIPILSLSPSDLSEDKTDLSKEGGYETPGYLYFASFSWNCLLLYRCLCRDDSIEDGRGPTKKDKKAGIECYSIAIIFIL